MKNLVILLSLFLVGTKELPSFSSLHFQEEVIYIAVDESPEFLGGEKGLRNYLKSNVKFPAEAMRAKVNGRVVAKFVVEKDGSISTVEILKGIGYGCDEETVRVIKAMPKWKSGIHKKKPVRTYYTIPVSFLATS